MSPDSPSHLNRRKEEKREKFLPCRCWRENDFQLEPFQETQRELGLRREIEKKETRCRLLPTTKKLSKGKILS